MTRTAADKYGQAGMACPACGEVGLNVLDSRPKDKNSTIRRRRVCPSCGHRATTFEVVVTEGQDLRKLMAVLRLDVLTALAKFNQAVEQMSPEDVR